MTLPIWRFPDIATWPIFGDAQRIPADGRWRAGGRGGTLMLHNGAWDGQEIVSAVWICDTSGRAFAVTYLTAAVETSPDDLLAALEGYLAGLACH
jgi:hypothetical protein